MTIVIYTGKLRNLCDLFYCTGVEPNVQYIQGGPVLFLTNSMLKIVYCLENTFLKTDCKGNTIISES